MMIQAVLGNPYHPEYGVATIPFPIPHDQYTHCMELLEALEIGDAVKADCQVQEINSFYSVLKRMEMLTVNGVNAVPWKPERSASNIKSCMATAKVRMVSQRSFRNRRRSSDGSMSAISPEPACG